MLSVPMFIVHVGAQANRQVQMEAQVALKLQEEGLSSLTSDDITVILRQVCEVRAVLMLAKL